MANWKKLASGAAGAAGGGGSYWVLEENWSTGFIDSTIVYADTDSDNNYIIAFRGRPSNSTFANDPAGIGSYSAHIGVIKVDTNGSIQWIRAIGEGDLASYPLGLKVDGNDDIHVLAKGDYQTSPSSQQATPLVRLSGSTGAVQDEYLLNLGSNYTGWMLYLSMAFGTINGTESLAINTRTKKSHPSNSYTGISVGTLDANPYTESSEVAKFITQPNFDHNSQLKSLLFNNSSNEDIFFCPYKNQFGSGEVYFYHQDARNLGSPSTRYLPVWAMPANTTLDNSPGYWGGAHLGDSRDTIWLVEQVGGTANPGYFLFGGYDFRASGNSNTVGNLGKPWKIDISGNETPSNIWWAADAVANDADGNLYALIFIYNSTTTRRTSLLVKMSNMTQATFNTSTGPNLEWALQIKTQADDENAYFKNVNIDENGDVFIFGFDTNAKEVAIIKIPPDGSITGNAGSKYELVDQTSNVSFSQWSAVTIYPNVNVNSDNTNHSDGTPDTRAQDIDVDYSAAFNMSLTSL